MASTVSIAEGAEVHSCSALPEHSQGPSGKQSGFMTDIQPLAGDRSEKRIVAGTEILAVAEHEFEAAKNANFGLNPGVP